MTTRFCFPLIAAAIALTAAPVAAQLLPGAVGRVVGGIDRTVGNVTAPVFGRANGEAPGAQQALVGGAFDRVSTLASSVAASSDSLLDLRRLRLSLLVDAHRAELARDGDGNVVRRDRLVAVEPDTARLAAAARAGFRVIGGVSEPELGMRLVTLAIPPRMNPRKALDRLREAAPGIDADFDHVFEPAGGALSPSSALLAAGAAGLAPAGTRIAMIDGGVASHPSMARASIEQKGFAGAASATGHGTAVASLLVGDEGAFRGAARGASLFVADVYGGNPAAGAASTIVRALGWAASKNPRLVNISLVGPANRAIERAVAGLRARGIMVVAAVGNDGPAAPPQYPASYDGVVAVTGVDAKGKALVEAGRARHLDFAAPGAELAAALPGKGYASVRGTSFAAPLAAARLATAGSPDRLAAEARPGKGKVGRGIVCGECRVAPKAVGAR
jgi:hypothetical protein